jgi:hypothetical protein
MFHRGMREPFADVGRSELASAIEQGQRPKLPAECPPETAEVIAACWQYEANLRPNFS